MAAIDQEGVDRVTAAQAADELLSLKGVKASFVVFPSGENVQMSVRSLGEVNVQVILRPWAAAATPPLPAAVWRTQMWRR